MELPEFNQANVRKKICELKALPAAEREVVANEIRTDLKAYIQSNFTLDEFYSDKIENMPDTFAEEMASGVSIAIREDNWQLVVELPSSEGEPVETERKKNGNNK